MPQFETVENLRRLTPGQAGTLIPSWNTGYDLRPTLSSTERSGTIRPGQRLVVVEAENGWLHVRQDAEGLEGWLPAHVVSPWPNPPA